MSRYLDRALETDEKVIYQASLHWIVYHMGIFFVALGFLVGTYAPSFLFDLISKIDKGAATYILPVLKYASLGIVIWGALLLLIGFIRQVSTELIITNRRVIAKYGFISTTTFELMIPKVEGANIDQTILGRVLGFGTVMVKGTGGGISPIDHVARPYIFHTHLMDAVRSMHRHDQEASKDD